mmetsp:Transcript_31370/g.66026  ORF Transcript_31370/g.66026 Transcript_31370/m.66026 type:complete len:260 (+) Transcript_31370:115-894(+)
MINPNQLFLIISVYTALLCGLEFRIGFIGAAAATTAANVKSNRATTCGAGSDQPHCNDPSYDYDGDEAAPAQASKHADAAERRATNTPRGNKAKDGTICASGDNNCASLPPSTDSGGSWPKFQSGDIIELYNTESPDIQIVFPSIVKGVDPSPSGGLYRVTKTTDGKEVTNLPEKFLHKYVPYSAGDEALCNIGEFKKARPIIVRCTVIEYEPAASRGAMVLQGDYSVQVHATKANEEYETSLPVWKLQRRYRATATTG